MRGKGCKQALASQQDGITPAHAGKSEGTFKVAPNLQDHPRTCGEKSCVVKAPQKETGSPPHMRGKVDKEVVGYNDIRITPAHAGKSTVNVCNSWRI